MFFEASMGHIKKKCTGRKCCCRLTVREMEIRQYSASRTETVDTQTNSEFNKLILVTL